MKRLLLALLVGLASTTAFADHAQDSLGLGGVFGWGWGWGAGWVPHTDFYPASLSLKIPKLPIFWGLNVRLSSDYDFGMGITGDYYFVEPNLVSTTKTNDDGSYQLKIDWYVGAGFYVNMYKDDQSYRRWDGRHEKIVFGCDGGLRVPFGVSWHAMGDIKKLEVSMGSVGGVGLGGNNYDDKPYFHLFFIPVEIAVRWWFG
jgi:hypothetical protein